MTVESFQMGTLVVRAKTGPLHSGAITEPTTADLERRYSVHGQPDVNSPMVLVTWRVHQSWEYATDLRALADPRAT